MYHFKKSLLALLLVATTISCHAQRDEVFVTANTNLCPNCYNQYRMLDSIGDNAQLHLVFQRSNPKEAQKFTDKFLRITRDFDLVCDDSLFQSYSHNIFPWLHYYRDGMLLFDANLGHYDQWIPMVNWLMGEEPSKFLFMSLPDDLTMSENSRCIALKDDFLLMDYTYNELHLLDTEGHLQKTQDFSKVDFPWLYQNIFGTENTWQEVGRYTSKIGPYIPDFGKVKLDNGCVFHDTLFLLVNVNYTETYFNENRQDTTVRVKNESAIIGLDGQLNIQIVYPLRFRDSLCFEGFTVNAYPHCVFHINDWNNIVLSVSQKEESEKHILCKMERNGNEIQFKSLIDNAFVPDFNEKHHLGTSLCLIKADDENAFFNVAPVITKYESGRVIELPFSNEKAHFDLKNGVAEAEYILMDASQTVSGDFLLLYSLQSKNKISLVDCSGSLVWTLHLPDECKKVYLVEGFCFHIFM